MLQRCVQDVQHRSALSQHHHWSTTQHSLTTSPAQSSAHQLTFLPSLSGSLNVYLRLKGQTAIENPLWSSSGNKGQHWNQARVNINPPTSFQVRDSSGLRVLCSTQEAGTRHCRWGHQVWGTCSQTLVSDTGFHSIISALKTALWTGNCFPCCK